MDISRINRTGPVGTSGKAGGAKRTGDFSKLLSVDDTEETAATGGLSGVGGMDALLFAQETGDALDSRKRGRQRGETLLEKLEELRLSLLEGAVPKVKLDNIMRLVNEKRGNIDDPLLSMMLDDIDLRAQVELAKLGY